MKSLISSSFLHSSFSLTSIHVADKLSNSELLYTQKNVAFVVVSSFSYFDYKMARPAVITSYDSADMMPFEGTRKVKGSGRALHVHSLHANAC